MTDAQSHSEPRLASSLGLLGLCLLPGLIAFLPGFYRALWNFSDPVQQTYLTLSRVVLLSFLLAVVFAPFVGAGVALLVGRKRTRSWSLALQSAATWAALLGWLAFVAVAFSGGGF